MTIFAFTRHTGVRIAEIGFALIVLAGVLLTFGQISRRFGRTGTIAAGASLAAGAVIILVAIRWGSFGAIF